MTCWIWVPRNYSRNFVEFVCTGIESTVSDLSELQHLRPFCSHTASSISSIGILNSLAFYTSLTQFLLYRMCTLDGQAVSQVTNGGQYVAVGSDKWEACHFVVSWCSSIQCDFLDSRSFLTQRKSWLWWDHHLESMQYEKSTLVGWKPNLLLTVTVLQCRAIL